MGSELAQDESSNVMIAQPQVATNVAVRGRI